VFREVHASWINVRLASAGQVGRRNPAFLLGDDAVHAAVTPVEALNFWKSRLPLLTEFLNTCQM
jgi:hypothetical protein